jgi:hypothetical protein
LIVTIGGRTLSDYLPAIKDSYDLAKKDGLTGGQILASQAGGVSVDVTKVAVTTTAATVATSIGAAAMTGIAGAFGAATAPVWATAIGAVGGSYLVVKGLDSLDKRIGITKGLKKGVNGIIKGIGGWFK